MDRFYRPEDLIADPGWKDLPPDKKVEAVDRWAAATRIKAETEYPDMFNFTIFRSEVDRFRSLVAEEIDPKGVGENLGAAAAWTGEAVKEGALSLAATVPAAARQATELGAYARQTVNQGVATLLGDEETAAAAGKERENAAVSLRLMAESLKGLVQGDSLEALAKRTFSTEDYEKSQALEKQISERLLNTDWKNPADIKAALAEADSLRMEALGALYDEPVEGGKSVERSMLKRRMEDNALLAARYGLTGNPETFKQLMEATGGSTGQREIALNKQWLEAELGQDRDDRIAAATRFVASIGGWKPEWGENMEDLSNKLAEDPTGTLSNILLAGAGKVAASGAAKAVAAGAATKSASQVVAEISERTVAASRKAGAQQLARGVAYGASEEAVSGAVGELAENEAPSLGEVAEAAAREAVGGGAIAGGAAAYGAVRGRLSPEKTLWAIDENGVASPVPNATDADLVALREAGARVIATRSVKPDGSPVTPEDVQAAARGPVPRGEAATRLDEIINDAGRTDQARREAEQGQGDVEGEDADFQAPEETPQEAPSEQTSDPEISPEVTESEQEVSDTEAVTEEDADPFAPVPYERLVPGMHGEAEGVRGVVQQDGARFELHSNDGTTVIELNPDTPVTPVQPTLQDVVDRIVGNESSTPESVILNAAEGMGPVQSAGRAPVVTRAKFTTDDSSPFTIRDARNVRYQLPEGVELEEAIGKKGDALQLRMRRARDGRDVVLQGDAALNAVRSLFPRERLVEEAERQREAGVERPSGIPVEYPRVTPREGAGRRRRAEAMRQRAATQAQAQTQARPRIDPVESLRRELVASGRNPGAIPGPELEAMSAARTGDAAAFKSLPPIRKKAVSDLVLNARDRVTGRKLGIPPEEFDRLDASESIGREPHIPADPLYYDEVAGVVRRMGLSVRDPNLRPRGRVRVVTRPDLRWEGRLLSDGTIELNTPWLYSEADVARVIRHELAHLAERDPGNADALKAMVDSLTDAERESLISRIRAAGYDEGAISSEVIANVTEQMVRDFSDRPAWRRLLARITEWLKRMLGRPVTRAEAEVMATRMIANTVRNTAARDVETASRDDPAYAQPLNLALELVADAAYPPLPDGPIPAIHYSRDPFDVNDREGDEDAGDGSESVMGYGLYLSEVQDESMWNNMPRLVLGEHRNELTVNPKNPLIVSPGNVLKLIRMASNEVKGIFNSNTWFDAWLSDQVRRGPYDAIIIRGFNHNGGGIRDKMRELERRLDGMVPKVFKENSRSLLNGDERNAARDQLFMEELGVTSEELFVLLDMQNQIFVPPNKIRSVGLMEGDAPAYAQPLDALVLTPSGWRRMGDLNPGDRVLAPSGRVVKIAAIRDYGVREAFEVRLDNGASTLATSEHKWLARITGSSMRVIDTEIIQARLRRGLRTDIQAVAFAE